MNETVYEFHAVIQAVPDKGGAYVRFYLYPERFESATGEISRNSRTIFSTHCAAVSELTG